MKFWNALGVISLVLTLMFLLAYVMVVIGDFVF